MTLVLETGCSRKHKLASSFSSLHLAAHIQTSRALMVISLLLGFFGIIVSVVGMKCTKVGEEDPVTKSRIAVAGGVLFILSGTAAPACRPSAAEDLKHLSEAVCRRRGEFWCWAGC